MKKSAAQGDLFASREEPAAPKPQTDPVPAWRRAAPPPPAPAAAEPAAPPVVLTVGELTRQIKTTLERGFTRVLVRGEVSGYRGPNPRGHLYFSLKDADACLDVKMWASAARALKFKLRDGLSLVATGTLDVYEPQGRYSLIAAKLEPEGEGALALAFQQLKDRLAEEGLIGDKRKRPLRPLPFLPRRIGVVTSTSGAALRDFLRVLHQRHPKLSVLVCDARVQGEGSAAQVVRAIERLSRTDIDVLVVTRGGGSIEDLWTFNEESVARALFACPVPVVSAIGHEVDFTIADFVADFRAPTPSAAAERLAPVLRELELGLKTCQSRLHQAVRRRVVEEKHRLQAVAARIEDPRRVLGHQRLHLSEQAEAMRRAIHDDTRALREGLKKLKERLERQRPEVQLQAKRQQLRRASERLMAAMRVRLQRERQALSRQRIAVERASPRRSLEVRRRGLAQARASLHAAIVRQRTQVHRQLHGLEVRLDAMNPLKVMTRGYALAFRQPDGRLIRQASDVAPGDRIALKLAPPGTAAPSDCEEIEAQVTQVKPRG